MLLMLLLGDARIAACYFYDHRDWGYDPHVAPVSALHVNTSAAVSTLVGC